MKYIEIRDRVESRVVQADLIASTQKVHAGKQFVVYLKPYSACDGKAEINKVKWVFHYNTQEDADEAYAALARQLLKEED